MFMLLYDECSWSSDRVIVVPVVCTLMADIFTMWFLTLSVAMICVCGVYTLMSSLCRKNIRSARACSKCNALSMHIHVMPPPVATYPSILRAHSGLRGSAWYDGDLSEPVSDTLGRILERVSLALVYCSVTWKYSKMCSIVSVAVEWFERQRDI